MYSKKLKQRVLALINSAIPVTEIAKELKISRLTVQRWKKQQTIEQQDTRATIKNLKKQLAILSKRNPTEAVSRKIAMISKALATQERIETKEEKAKTPKPYIALEVVGGLRERALKEAELYSYQSAFLKDEAQFRIILKSRQIGFSYVAALDALCAAHDNGRNQLFLSASEEQALILMSYLTMWANKFGVTFKKNTDTEKVLQNGAVIKALAHNFRTVQGFTGDVWMDEFAWYPNPKKIWHAFVPSIGAIQGRLTILSTPFEEAALFHNLWSDDAKYYMFSHHRVDIYTAMRDGLKFDLEIMRALFDADTWASAYECQFIDDESALFSIALIKSCVDVQARYYTPHHLAPLIAGYDVGRIKDSSALAVLSAKDGGKYDLCILDVLRKAKFDEQKMHLKAFMSTNVFARLRLDKTGIGMNLTEDITKEYKSRAQGVYFTAVQKEAMSLNLKKMFEDKLITIPNDPLLIADIHAIKRKAGAKGFLYDADRNEHGHADRYWAMALAASHAEILQVKRGGRAYLI
ncbi:MAG: terminase family protein [Campylobacteraceae bacterium]|jgi:phage FluMu gp28-like protein|nr:terminase family protein [Campylobacteraceae bacterium]